MLLNDSFVQTQASALGARIVREAGGREEKQIERAFRLVLQRAPTRVEARAAVSLLADQRQRAVADGASDPAGIARR